MKSFTSKKITTAISVEAESRREWMMKIFQRYGKFNPNNKDIGKVVSDTRDIGWGFHDYLGDVYSDFYAV